MAKVLISLKFALVGAFLRVTLMALLDSGPVLSHTCGGLRNFSRLYNQFSGEKVHSFCERSEMWMKQALRGMKKQKEEMPHNAKYWLTCFSACRSPQCFDDIQVCLSELRETKTGNRSHHPAIEEFGFGPGFFANGTGRKKRAIKESLDRLGRSESKKVIRKEIRRLTPDERRRIFAAVNHLKHGPKIDKLSKMDILIVYHTPEYAPTAHFCATFFPYHREYLKNFELATRLIEPDLGLPYWDTTLEEALPDPKDSIIWTDDFFGTGVGELTNGPFADWRPRPDPLSPTLQHLKKLTRNVGENYLGALLKERDVQELLSKKAFREFDYCVDPFLELIHGSNHLWIGGHMSDTRVAPNDPVFFFLHSFFDLIWEQWRHKHQTREQRVSEFVTDKGNCNPYCSTTNLLKPFPMKETDGLSNFYTDNLYEYEDRPTCSVWKPDCGSPYLFCDTRRYRCLSKVRKNGNCNGFDGTDICYKSLCVRGRCSAKALWNKTADDDLHSSKKTTPLTVNTETPIQTESRDFVGIFENKRDPSIVQQLGDDLNSGVGGSKTVWVPVTVILQARGQNQAYPGARIITKDLRYNITLYGRHANSSDEPYVTGSAFARVLDPFAHRGPIEATIRVYGEMGDECSALCLNKNLVYEPCRAKLKLSIRPEDADDIPFTPNFNLAKYLNWLGRERSPDKFMFICSKSTISITTTKKPNIKAFPVMQAEPANLRPEPSAVQQAPIVKTTYTTTKSPILSTVRPASLSEQVNGPAPPRGTKNVKPLVFPSSLGFASQNDKKNSRTIVASGCLNTHICCNVWATKGECRRDGRLRRLCQNNCGLCRDNSNSAGQCVDKNVLCPTWAKENQCETNTFWMQENCRRSCQACNRTLSQLEVMCTAVKNCQNMHNYCDYWSIVNECNVNPKWMAENCPRACKKCFQ